MGGAILTLVSRVKKLERTVKQLRTARLVGDAPATEGDVDIRDEVDLDGLSRMASEALGHAQATVPSVDIEEREEEEVPLRRKRSVHRRARTEFYTPAFAQSHAPRSTDVPPPADISESAGPSVGADKGKAPMPEVEIPAEFLAEDAQARKRLEDEQASARLVQQLQAEDLAQADVPPVSEQRAKELDELLLRMTDTDWLTLMMQVGTNPALARELLGADVTEDNFIERMTAIKERKKRALADLRYRALKGKPLKQSEVTKMMRNLVLTISVCGSICSHPACSTRYVWFCVDSAGGPLDTTGTASNIPTSAAMDSAASHHELGISPFADSDDSSSPSPVSTDHVPIDVLVEPTPGGIHAFFLDSDEDEQIGLSRVAAEPDSDDEVLAEILFRGQYVSGAGVVVVDTLPDDEIVDPRVKVEPISASPSSPPRSRSKHRGVRSDTSLWDRPVDDFLSSESESDDDIEEYIPPIPYGAFKDWEIVRCPLRNTYYHVYYQENRRHRNFFYLKELLPHVYREDLLLLRRRMNRYFRLNPDVDVGLDLWRDVNLLCQSLHSDDVEDFWRTQDEWVVSGWRLYPKSSVHVLDLTNGKTVYMFVDKFYPIRAPLLERMLRHRLTVPPSYCRDVVVAGSVIQTIQDGLRESYECLASAPIACTARHMVFSSPWLTAEKEFGSPLQTALVCNSNPLIATHALIWKNKEEIETISLDDLYNNLKIYEPKLAGSSSTSQNPQNVAFVSSNITNSNCNSSTNEANNTAHGVSAGHTQCNSTSGDNLSDAMICAFLASKPNSPQLAREDLEQIDPDDLEEMDLQWEMAMLTIRARRFIQRTCKKLDVNGQRVGFDRTKVECYNCHKYGHFARECKVPKNQENRGKENNRRTVTGKTPTKNALVAQDGLGGYDWSYQTEKEQPYNFA
ncbi:reverse transcriptase domain-containing protein [Tanacetum coccineum]